MKYALGAVAAVALGLSVVSAQAQASQPQTNPKQANAGHAISQKDKIKQAQQALKDEGLYKGKIDGNWGRESRQALMQFEKRNNMPASGKLDSKTFAALTQGTAPNVGSSLPNQQGSGQMKPAPQSMPAVGAGGNGGSANAPAGGAQH